MARDLTEKQRRFVEAYTGPALGNATKAAHLAGYRGNRVTLEAVGRENLGKPRVAEAIAAVQAEVREKAIITRDEIIGRLASIGRGQGQEPHVLQSGAVVLAEPNFAAQRAALMDAAKLMGMLVDKVEVKAADALKSQLLDLQRDLSPSAFEELLVALSKRAG